MVNSTNTHSQGPQSVEKNCLSIRTWYRDMYRILALVLEYEAEALLHVLHGWWNPAANHTSHCVSTKKCAEGLGQWHETYRLMAEVLQMRLPCRSLVLSPWCRDTPEYHMISLISLGNTRRKLAILGLKTVIMMRPVTKVDSRVHKARAMQRPLVVAAVLCQAVEREDFQWCCICNLDQVLRVGKARINDQMSTRCVHC